MSEGRDSCASSSRENRCFLPLPFCSVLASWGWGMPTHLGEEDLFLSVYCLNANVFQKHPQGHTHNALPAMEASLDPVRWTHQVNHHHEQVDGRCVHQSERSRRGGSWEAEMILLWQQNALNSLKSSLAVPATFNTIYITL